MWRLVLASVFAAIVTARRLNDIHWNSTNPIFDLSNNDHVLSVSIGDRLSIICPSPNAPTYEYSIIYAVSQEEYSHCYLGQNPHRVGACDSPNVSQSLSIVFREFSPTPGGLEFAPGATSTGTMGGLERRRGGLCESNKMKLRFNIESAGSQRHPANPKFAARTFEDASTTPVMYIIHADDSTELDDDGVSSVCLLPVLLSMCLLLLHRL